MQSGLPVLLAKGGVATPHLDVYSPVLPFVNVSFVIESFFVFGVGGRKRPVFMEVFHINRQFCVR